jgi:NAD(P)-dependent dehydrogenase (short-subunit alcohol dehydrogenase family)
MPQERVAVVSGSNKGIGFAVVRGLCKQFSGHVYLTARDEARGQAAVVELEKEGLHPKFHQLDINDVSSIQRLYQFLLDTYGGLDILVNNAAIAYKVNSTAPFTEQAEVTLKTNYWGTLNVCNVLFPLLRPHARVVNVSSISGKMALNRCSDALRSELLGCRTIDEVSRYMTKFVHDVKNGNHTELGWPSSAYGISKSGVTLVTPIMQREIDADASRSDVVINACCPGYVATDMSSYTGTKTTDEGADTLLYLALLPPDVTSPRGEFIRDRQIQPIV